MDITTGTRLNNRYEITGMLGKGGFGQTYLAIDHMVNRFVAIKASEQSLAHEAKILKSLHDVPHISHIYDYFVIDKVHYIVMRYIKGNSLSAFREENGGTLSIKVLTQVLPSVFIALDQMHERGIIHRDISPGNFIMTEEKILYLIDFGTATSIKEIQLKNHLVFRHQGLEAPEHSNSSIQGAWTDVYSLCSTIVYLLTGTGVPGAEDRRQFDPVPLMLTKSSLSSHMQNALLRGLSLEAGRRYDSVYAFAHDFMSIDRDESSKDKYSVHYHAKTHIGSRDVNQDNFMVDTRFAYAGEDCEIKGYIDCDCDEYHVVAVADGVAAAMHSELASKAVIQAVSHFLEQNMYSEGLAEKLMEELLDQINEKINTLSKKIGKTASTIAIFLWRNDSYCVANIGDSPLYLLRGNSLCLLSREQTRARERLDAGLSVVKKDFNTLTRYLGMEKMAGSQAAYISTGKIKKGDIFFLCSDGVSKMIPDRKLCKYLKKDGDKAMKKIYSKCIGDVRSDNCTSIILKF